MVAGGGGEISTPEHPPCPQTEEREEKQTDPGLNMTQVQCTRFYTDLRTALKRSGTR